MTTNKTTTTSTPPALTIDEIILDKSLVCAKAALEKKAENLRVMDLREISSFTDYFVICSGQSERQVQAIANSVENALGLKGYDLIAMEGYGEGRWILMDTGDIVVHIFLDALRDYYDLESLWAQAPRIQVPSEYYSSHSEGSNFS